MPITVKDGDMFASGCQALVNPTNVDPGYMGALAGVFSRRYMGLERDYVAYVAQNKPPVGDVWVWQPKHKPEGDPTLFVVNMATCAHAGGPSAMPWVEQGLKNLIEPIKEHGIKSLAIPALGAGVGGLNWDEVKQAIQTWYDRNQHELQEVEVVVFNPLPLGSRR